MTRLDTFLLGCIFGAAIALSLVYNVVKATEQPARELNERMALTQQEYPFRPDDYYFSPWSGKRIP